MKKQLIRGLIAGICLTEVLQYFGPQSAVLFYCYVLAGAVTASVVSRRAVSGMIISGYVVVWKFAGMVLLMRTYGVQAVMRGISPFLIDWALVVLIGIVGGYAGAALGKHFKRERTTAP